MKKIIIVLFSALVVFVGTFLVTDRYVTNKMITATDKVCNYEIDELANDFNGDIQITEEAVVSFLSGNFVCDDDIFPADSLRGDSTADETYFYIDNKGLKNFPEWFHQNLKDFLHVNPYFRNAIFMVDENVCQKYKKYGYETKEPGGGEVILGHYSYDKDILNYDFMHSVSYNSVKSTLKSQWRLPSLTSPMKGKIVSYYVPVCCEDGSFFGVFVLNLDISMIRDKIVRHLPYGTEDSEMIISDSKGNVIASCPQQYESFLTLDSLRKTHEVEYSTYKRTLKDTNWIVYTFCNPKAVYQEATYIRWMMVFFSIIGFVLVLICFFILYKQAYRNLKAKAAAEEEIRVAAKVQMSMLKQKHYDCGQGISLENVLIPAKSAGGDLYDYIFMDGKLIFCIGDVSGKGLSAALFMTQVVSLFRNAVRDTTNPAEIVSQMNEVLSENNPDMTFCTFFVGVLSNEQLSFCNAGHNPPIFIPHPSPLTPHPSYLKLKPNIALGLFGDFTYVSETMAFPAGSKLINYTDGVTEAKDVQHEQYGEDRLLSVLSSAGKDADFNQLILQDVGLFVGNAEQSDDITIVTVSAG